jgi:hypothetical protein
MIHRIKKNPSYFQTYRPTGAAAPDPVTHAEEKVPIFVGRDSEEINASEAIDVYVFVRGGVDGRVRVDV